MQSYVAQRIPTARLLDEAWVACQAEEKNAMRASVLGQIEEQKQASALDLDSLNDVEVDRLYHGTLKRIANDSRY
jgi:hypothetical protein